MAREEADREDLLKDATAYRQRIQWQFPAWDSPVFVGFRAEGAVSFYFGADPVYHFNAQNELRRLYLQGSLLKAVGGRLVRMQRVRREQQVELRSQELSPAEQDTLCEKVFRQLRELSQTLNSGRAQLQGQVPDSGDVTAQVRNWLAQLDSISIADSAHL